MAAKPVSGFISANQTTMVTEKVTEQYRDWYRPHCA